MGRYLALFFVGLAFVCPPSAEAQRFKPAPKAKKEKAAKTPQAKSGEPLRLRWNLLRGHALKVVNSEGGNTLLLKESDRGAIGIEGNWLDLSEGFYVGLNPIPDPAGLPTISADKFEGSHLFRGEVKSIRDDGVVVLGVASEVAAALNADDQVMLFRPAGMSTADIKRVPDAITVSGKPAQDGDKPESTDQRADANSPVMAARMAHSRNNLRQIGLALHNYHDSFLRFPPAVIIGPDGKPWHSWRVLLLPFIDQTPLYNEYRFDEPWNSDHNLKVAEKMPSAYSDPIYGQNKEHFTHYAAAFGPGTSFPAPGAEFSGKADQLFGDIDKSAAKGTSKIHDFTDGTSNTLMVGSVSPEKKILWTQPEDVRFDEKFPALGEKDSFATPYGAGENAAGLFLFADGSIHTLTRKLPVDTLRNLITIADGKIIAEMPGPDPNDGAPGGSAAPGRPQLQFPVFVVATDKGNAPHAWVEMETVKIRMPGQP